MTVDPGRRVACVIGGTRGIGRAVARRLAAAGGPVVITGRDRPTADASAAELAAETGAEVTAVALDVRDFAGAAGAVRALVARHGRLDALVVSAGAMHNAPLGMVTEEAVRQTLDTHVAGPIAVLQAAARAMMRRRAGSITLIGSTVGRDGPPGQLVYAAAKSALTGLVSSAARELGPYGVRVNAVAPGLVATRLLAEVPERTLAARTAETPLRRLGTPEDVAAAVAYLAGEDASFVTGQTLAVDGGLVL
ncbi:SDR family oxidoreductase [Streptomyces sp. DSM 44915]|uniref:SDR family oxidoreductase n=1 Tax=Streptomyces chisholmiae TaxID=3075540 RepID=A0ABU2JPD9_9ACTN|nr:SDR family oxidoreductase [Streptomyces sp. DSM 44915]MDT0266593.1 SDR family oxidoreductase [Streptomyces sp. DSM 44915]